MGDGYVQRRVEVVGPAVSGELRKTGIIAVLASLLAIVAYVWFRFEWQFAVGAIVTLILDVTKTVGFFALTGLDFNLTAIAALLTLVGYSVNDTIVVFDRIRENIRLNRRESIADIANRSINQTLSRTILTSGLTFLSVISLFLFGGDVLRAFSFTLVVGIIVGTYSSISVASTVVVSWIEYTRIKGGQSAASTADRPRGAGKRAKAAAGASA